MTIQTVILGDPIYGNGGDKYRDAHNKINTNFVYVDRRIAAVDAALTSRIDALEPKVTANTTAIGNIGLVPDATKGDGGIFGFEVRNGDLILKYSNLKPQADFHINEQGQLIATIN